MAKMDIKVFFLKNIKIVFMLAAASAAMYFFFFRPVKVVLHKVKRGKIVNLVMGTGTLEAKKKTIISSKIFGRIKKVLVDQGDSVKAGELVVMLDDDEAKMQVRLAKAGLETAKATMKKLKSDYAYAKAVLDNAEKEYERLRKLIKNNVVSQSDLDKAWENLQVARAKLDRSNSAIVEAEKKIIEAKENIELRKAQLDYTQIEAPFDGTIVLRTRDPGDITVPGTPILSLVSTKTLWVESWVGETELEKVKPGQPAKIVFRSLPKNSYPGTVARLARQVDTETREFIVDVSVSKLPDNWAVGQRAEVYIETATNDNALIVPEDFVEWKDGNSGVFIADDGKAKWITIKTGLSGDGVVEAVSGLKEGDELIRPVGDKNELTDGSRISPK